MSERDNFGYNEDEKHAGFAMTHILSAITQLADDKLVTVVNKKGDTAEMVFDLDFSIDGQDFNVSITAAKI